MSAKEQLLKEIEQAPDPLIEEILDFCLFVKERQHAKEMAKPISSEPQANSVLDLLERVREIQAQVPSEEWDKLPHDGSINHDHYLYGSPKVEE